MGIPKMFRFLTDRYPLIMQRLDEDHVFDHFYLDMNGIIHQCTHPNDDEIAIYDTDLMFSRIFNYTDRLFRIVSPRSLMFLAVDGVAPRAKMNQQRSRRFRSAKEAERALSEAIARGDDIPSGVRFDSNCITPGTEFMFNLSERFRHWIDSKMKTDPAWQKGCTVVFSGSEVPGEGEHKIMDFIRKWKSSDRYDPQVWHCMYGLDADLMMLGLVAHTPHFTLIREKMKFTKSRRRIPEMTGTDRDADEFELLEIARLREMLFLEFQRQVNDPLDSHFDRRSRKPPTKFERKAILATFPSRRADSKEEGPNSKRKVQPFRVDRRRVVDDFVFMCMLVGNDFLPHLAHLDIGEGAINIMFRIYKEMLPGWGGYLTNRHQLHPDRLESFLQRVAQSEPQYFEHRAFVDNIVEYKTPEYRRQYYLRKFNFDIQSEDCPARLQRLRRIYMEGLHWVLQYYHNGVSSWNWFYPDFYAVLASDMVNLRQIKVTFQRGRPFNPLTQLMAVLPPESAHFLPDPMRFLMTDPNSPVADFYPQEFKTDMNGKRNEWEAVVIIPFIEEKRLLEYVNAIDYKSELTANERERNKTGKENWFHARDYPYSDAEIFPVRPSKYFIPYSARSRSPSSSSSRSPSGRTSRSSSRGSLSSSSPGRSNFRRTRSPSPTGRGEEPWSVRKRELAPDRPNPMRRGRQSEPNESRYERSRIARRSKDSKSPLHKSTADRAQADDHGRSRARPNNSSGEASGEVPPKEDI
eukprot:GFKZ01013920.1.p1 GENE.GFKZ01013920.1~~GFKZ01013920.1.p1  ORF type:complete len:747 (-),score=96.43 GFKZ01013920.1:2972-5212(-)